MRRRKAARPAIDKSSRKPRAISARQQRDRKASRSYFMFQALAVFDGQQFNGHLLPRGKAGVEAFDADDRSLGSLSDTGSGWSAEIPQSEVRDERR
jgi:hypothetical protein